MLTDITPISELKQLTDPEDSRYPSEEFLICLREEKEFVNNIENYIDIIEQVWYDSEYGFDYDSKNRTLKLDTLGWSGNEDILEALSYNPFWWMYHKDETACGHHVFRFNQT